MQPGQCPCRCFDGNRSFSQIRPLLKTENVWLLDIIKSILMCSMILRLLWFNVIHLSLVMMNPHSSRCSTKLPTSPRLSLWHLYTWTASEVEPSGPTSHIEQETKVDLNSKNEDYLYEYIQYIPLFFVSLNIRKQNIRDPLGLSPHPNPALKQNACQYNGFRAVVQRGHAVYNR